MNDRDDRAPEPARPPSVGERNIERLLKRAYDPEEPNETFAAQVEAEMLAAARDEAARGRSLRLRRLLRAGAVAAAVAVGFAIGTWMARQAPRGEPADAGIAERPGAAAPVPLTILAAEGQPVPVENLLRPRPRPQVLPVEPLAPGSVVKTAALERRRVALADGSVLYVNRDTSLAVAAPRTVMLEKGEVYVIVAPGGGAAGEPAPFVVQTPRRRITALATRFGVRVADRGAAVSVTQGKVRISGFAGELQAGQQLGPDGRRVIPLPRATHVLDWTRDLMAAAQTPLVPRSSHAGGSLVVKDPAGQDVNLSLRKFHVDVHVEDGFARTTIDQTYFNHTARRLEGTFYFPLPADASLSRLAMYVNGRLMEGGMVERGRARQVYEDIVHKMLDPALLEWIDGTTFKMRVFPLEPRQEKRIILSSTQRLSVLYGRTTYRFPAGHSMEQVGKWSFRARVRHGAGWQWECDSHKLTGDTDGDDLFLTAEAENVAPDSDVVLRLHDAGAAAGAQQQAAAFSSAVYQDGAYLMLRFSPELPAEPRRRQRHWVFLFESSADRDPLLARTQIEVVRGVLAGAERDDTFCVVTAGTRAKLLADAPLAASPDNTERAAAFLDEAHLVGALDLEQALGVAGELCRAGANAHLVHLGSGIAALGERDPKKLLARVPAGARYVGVAVGKRWARDFMKSAAARTGGCYTQINPDENVAWRAFELVATLNTPRLLRVAVTGEPDGRAFLTCEDFLAQGEQLCAILRADKAGELPSAVRIRGELDGRPWEAELPVRDVAQKCDYLPRIWARLEIDRLLAEEPARNRQRIVELSKAMYVMSPFTSLLVLENEQMYRDYHVDRGRKDHWALYPCPEQIPVVHEPLGEGEEPARAKGRQPSPAKPAKKPWREDILRTILVRAAPPLLQPGDWPQSTPQEKRHYAAAATAWQLQAGAYGVPVVQVAGASGRPADTSLRGMGDDYSFGLAIAADDGGFEKYGRWRRTDGRESIATGLGTIDLSGWIDVGASFDPTRTLSGTTYDAFATDNGDTTRTTARWRYYGNGSRADLDDWSFLPWDASEDGGFLYATYRGGEAPPVVVLDRNGRIVGPVENLVTTVTIPDGGTLLLGGRRLKGSGLEGLGLIDFALHDVDGDDAFTGAAIPTFNGGMSGLNSYLPLLRWGSTASGATVLLADPLIWDYNDDGVAGAVLIRPRIDVGKLASWKEADRAAVPWYEYLRYPRNAKEPAEGRERSRSAAARAADADFELREKLTREIERLSFADIDFSDVIQFLREYAGVNIHVNWRAIEAAGIEPRTKVTVEGLKHIGVKRALELVLKDVSGAAAAADGELEYAIDDGVLTISTRADLARVLIRRVYDIRDLLVPVPRFAGPRVEPEAAAARPARRSESLLRGGGDIFRDEEGRAGRRVDDISELLATLPGFQGPGVVPSDQEGDFDTPGIFEDEGTILREREEEEISRRDLTDDFVHLVQNAIDRDSWSDPEGGGAGTGFIRVLNGQLVVTQTAENHRKLAELIEQLREARGLDRPVIGRAVRLVAGGGGRGIDRRPSATYQRPSFSGYEGYFTDLTLYAPALQTTRADILAVLEAEAPAAERPKGGHVAPEARKLLDAARAAGWQSVTLGAAKGTEPLTITFNGAGQYVCQRAVNGGLIEQAVCDGKVLLHLYGEIGLAARRTVSRFHRRELTALLPWLVPPPEDLAAGADVTCAAERTVVVTPLAAGSDEPATRRALHLVFAADGRLAERRLARLDGRVLLRQTLAPDGTVALLDEGGRTLATARHTLKPADAPNLEPRIDKLVVLPMPIRAPEHVLRARGLAGLPRDAWPEDGALAYLAGAIAHGREYHKWIGAGAVQKRFLQRGDQRVGLYVLLRAAGYQIDPPKELAGLPVAKYLLAAGKNPPAEPQRIDYGQFGLGDQDFLVRLEGFRRLWTALHAPEMHARAADARRPWCQEVLKYLHRTGPTAFSWALLSEAVPLLADGREQALQGQLAQAFGRFHQAPGLWPFARYESARALYLFGSRKQAANELKALYREMDAGRLPLRFDEALYQATKDCGWREMVRATASRLLKEKDRVGAVELAWRCWRAGDTALGAELLALARRDAPEAEKGPLKLAAVKYYCHTAQWARAAGLLAEALGEPRLAAVPALWRAAAQIAARCGQTAKALACHERALDLAYRQLGQTADLNLWRARYGQLLDAYGRLASVVASLRPDPPRELLAQVIRTADRWRAMEADPTAPCRAAAKALRRLGARELAWEYLTTPLAAKPNESAPWVNLAAELAAEGETDLADRAYATAFELESSNPQLLWDRARLLEQRGRSDQARQLLGRIVDGKWAEKHESLRRDARRLLAQ